MENNNSEVILYIVKPSETLDSIANKMNMSVEEIYQLNPLIRHSTLHAGQPLNLLARGQKTRSENGTNESCRLAMSLHVNAIKQLIISEIFVPNYIIPHIQTLRESNTSLIKCYENNLGQESDYNIKTLLEELQNNLISFISLVQKKDTKLYEKYNNQTNELISNFCQLQLAKNEHEDLIKDINKDWQMFIIKVLANKADEAEKTYKQIQNKYDEAIK